MQSTLITTFVITVTLVSLAHLWWSERRKNRYAHYRELQLEDVAAYIGQRYKFDTWFTYRDLVDEDGCPSKSVRMILMQLIVNHQVLMRDLETGIPLSPNECEYSHAHKSRFRDFSESYLSQYEFQLIWIVHR